MSAPVSETWAEANQRSLLESLARVRARLERHATLKAPLAPDAPEPAPTETPGDLPAPPALHTLCVAFGLSPFERDVVLLCAGIELDARFAAACAAAQGDLRRPWPTFSLALAVLPQPHWSALAPAAPLRRYRLLEPGTGDTLTQAALRLDERVLHFLTGVSGLDERLAGLCEPVPAPGALPPSHRALAGRIASLCALPGGASAPRVIQLCGSEPATLRAIASAACGDLGLRLHALRAADVPGGAAERETLCRLWEREAVLGGSALLIAGEDGDPPESARAATALADRVGTPLFIATREPLRLARRHAVRFDVQKPTRAEQGELWRDALGPLADRLDGQLDGVVAQFNLDLHGIHAASAALQDGLRATSTGERDEAVGPLLWDACRSQSRPRLEDLAERLIPAATWEDLVLPERERQTLREMHAHLRQRARVYETWGFARKGSRGLGISALFSGLSGTGKTLAAEVLARELRLDLYRIDLSQVVSKYIGETEKNLRRVFDAADEGGAILLFDEADALFGKRSEVKDSHDRYANIEVSYLLQRMEAYRGLAVLTTNMKDALDPAFLRRIRFVVQFPFPDAAQRAEIWRRIFPADTPTEGLDAERLARLTVAGGNIRNIALNAAFLAAEAGGPVRMEHLRQAARVEYARLEKPIPEAELGASP